MNDVMVHDGNAKMSKDATRDQPTNQLDISIKF